MSSGLDFLTKSPPQAGGWNVDSSLVPEKKMHLVEIVILSATLISVGILAPYAVSAAFATLKQSGTSIEYYINGGRWMYQ